MIDRLIFLAAILVVCSCLSMEKVQPIVTFSSSAGTGDFSIPDIDEFAIYQRALISAYAETNSYVYKHIGASVNDSTFQGVTDARWIKIKLLLDALDGWAKNTELIMWIDADAVILDFGLDLLGLAQRHPQADLLASADIRMGLINTGVLLLRNTPWMRRFLHHWWYGPQQSLSRSTQDASGVPSSAAWRSVCDQDAFDRLYTHYSSTWMPGSPRVSEKVKVLPMDALNSHPPAMVHQQPHSAVLHLMGEHTALRRELFRKAWSNVCAARSGGVLSLQLQDKKRELEQKFYADIDEDKPDATVAVSWYAHVQPVFLAEVEALPGEFIQQTFPCPRARDLHTHDGG